MSSASASTAFSSDGVDIISRKIASSIIPVEGPSDRKSERELRRYYEITRCVRFIKSDPKFERVRTKGYIEFSTLFIFVFKCGYKAGHSLSVRE